MDETGSVRLDAHKGMFWRRAEISEITLMATRANMKRAAIRVLNMLDREKHK